MTAENSSTSFVIASSASFTESGTSFDIAPFVTKAEETGPLTDRRPEMVGLEDRGRFGDEVIVLAEVDDMLGPDAIS